MHRYLVCLLVAIPLCGGAFADELPASLACTRSIQPPPLSPAAAAEVARAFRPAANGGAPELPRLVRLRDDLYVLQNARNTTAQIAQLGGNVTVYLTDEGVILFDSRYAGMHDFIVSKVRSLSDKPIRYVVLTHSHPDHAGGAQKMEQMGATVIISTEDRALMAAAHLPGLPQLAYHGQAELHLGGKTVQLREFCGHTRGDTVAWLPGPRVLIVGDLVTTPDSIPQIVGYADGGNWTDLGSTLNALATVDFDVMVPGHGPVLTKAQFLKQRDKVIAIRERVRELTREGHSEQDITRILLREFNYGSGPAAGQIGPMMQELR